MEKVFKYLCLNFPLKKDISIIIATLYDLSKIKIIHTFGMVVRETLSFFKTRLAKVEIFCYNEVNTIITWQKKRI